MSRSPTLMKLQMIVVGWLLSVLGCLAFAEELRPSPVACGVCDCSPPELWVISSRCAPKCQGLDEGFARLSYSRYDASRCRFTTESLESFLAAQANIPTILYAHGNSLDAEAALESCWKVYHRLTDCPGPKLMVMWSWPAEMVYKRPLIRPVKLARENIRTKYVYAEHQGYYIAKLTSLMSTAQPLTLSGHSFGGVAVICGLHYLGGGQLNGRTFSEGYAAVRPNLRASIISGAMDCDHLYPGHRYESALVAVEKLHTTFNTNDATLRRWPTLSFRGQEAVGYTGICAARLGENEHKLIQQNMTPEVGRSHYLKPHLASDRMVATICEIAFERPLCPCGGKPGTGMRVDPSMLLEVPAQTVFPGLAL